MAEDSLRLRGFPSGLAVLLNEEDKNESSSKGRLVSYCDEIRNQSIERAFEQIFDLPCKSLGPLTLPIDGKLIRTIVKDELSKLVTRSNFCDHNRDGIGILDAGCGPSVVTLDVFSICGDIRTIMPPLLVESLAMFSSVRANACVWKGKWMYEVILETSGIQQLGWATLTCPFTEQKGVGDADDSYAFDGRRVRKWNKEAEPYGQSWVAGDVIGCCIDLESDQISFYRNGVSLGVAFRGIRKMGPGAGYYPAISLSQGERCELNFGSHPFKFPVEGYLPLESPPNSSILASRLLQYFCRLLDIHDPEQVEYSPVGKLRRLKRCPAHEDLFLPVSRAILEELLCLIGEDAGSAEYVGCGPLLSFMIEVFRAQAPHDYISLDRVLDIFSEFQSAETVLGHMIIALARFCKTAPLILTECPYTGSYPYLALACHIFRRVDFMVLWWKSPNSEFIFEGFLTCKSPNREDLQCLMPSVWWPGSGEDTSCETSMMMTTTALSEAIVKIEERHREICRLVIQFVPPTETPQLPGSVFRSLIQNILLKNRGSDRDVSPPGISGKSILVSLYSVILHFLSEGFGLGDACSWLSDGSGRGYLHRGGQQSFPVGLFLKDDPHRSDLSRLGGSFSHLSKSNPVNGREDEIIRWEEGCMDDNDFRVTHSTFQKPCCCSNYDIDCGKASRVPIRYRAKGLRGHCSPIPDRSAHVAAECSAGSLNDEIADKASTSDQSNPEFSYRLMQHLRTVAKDCSISSATIREEELLDSLLLLYHMGLAPNFKQASHYASHQSQFISLLEDTDKQIREQAFGEKLKRLKEVKNGYREEIANCVRHCAWYRITLFSRWKQRGMYAACMWTVQLLLVISQMNSIFVFIPEFYVESLVDCFHVLRKSDPPFVPPSIFIKQGLSSLVTFLVTHFHDPRISSADLKDLLLQSISVLVQYKEFLDDFENNGAAIQTLPAALLSSFDNRSWIPVTNILLRLSKGAGFGFSKHGESSSSSVVFQKLLREACIYNDGLFSDFLNRLFNTLSWTMTEFSVSMREMQEKYQQVLDFRQRKCNVIFDLSCNLARLLEFCTHEVPQAFLAGSDTNLRRLTEIIAFSLNHVSSPTYAEFFSLSFRKHSQSSERVNKGMLLTPLVGIILNLLDASRLKSFKVNNDVVSVFASTDCCNALHSGFQYLLNHNWADLFRSDASDAKLEQIEEFISRLLYVSEQREAEDAKSKEPDDLDEEICCICYESEVDTKLMPCSHTSCYGCISRHLLNCERCFFCNAIISNIARI
ncbi:hypothetical protein MLD38_028453 [Melastoma candidum]|uniref:Uncharacterized protein n=1 Tax=Melastoma candidum TaxID=119954 RepID=A0ACB9N1Y2_9MYRT|nr:hypothetical protein MLD38_028453 [Melastoma candidum]